MVPVRPRSRRKRTKEREREVQGMLLAAVGGDAVTVEETEAVWSSGAPKASRKIERLPEIQALPYRQVLATWPDSWRERWGRLANEIEDRGISWRDAESRAFVEVWSRYRASADVHRN